MSQRKIKRTPPKAKQVRQQAQAALNQLGGLQDLPDLLRRALETNQKLMERIAHLESINSALVQENERLNTEVSAILEEHETKIAALEGRLEPLELRSLPYGSQATGAVDASD